MCHRAPVRRPRTTAVSRARGRTQGFREALRETLLSRRLRNELNLQAVRPLPERDSARDRDRWNTTSAAVLTRAGLAPALVRRASGMPPGRFSGPFPWRTAPITAATSIECTALIELVHGGASPTDLTAWLDHASGSTLDALSTLIERANLYSSQDGSSAETGRLVAMYAALARAGLSRTEPDWKLAYIVATAVQAGVPAEAVVAWWPHINQCQVTAFRTEVPFTVVYKQWLTSWVCVWMRDLLAGTDTPTRDRWWSRAVAFADAGFSPVETAWFLELPDNDPQVPTADQLVVMAALHEPD